MKIADIIEAVAEATHMEPRDLKMPGRQKKTAEAKHLARWMARDMLDYSYPEIGRAFRRDHTTIQSSVRVADRRLETDDDYRGLYMNALAILASRPMSPGKTGGATEEGEGETTGNTESRSGGPAVGAARRDSRPKIVVEPCERRCLKCGNTFQSEHRCKNWICRNCKSTEAWKSGEPPAVGVHLRRR